MPQVHRLSDPNDDDAVVTSVIQNTVYANNMLVSVDGSPVESHGLGEHDSPETANGSSTVFINGIPVNRQGDEDTCGHVRAEGSPDVFADG
jgi:uncharacterized Zn-binding protein involved in type VI secretion